MENHLRNSFRHRREEVCNKVEEDSLRSLLCVELRCNRLETFLVPLIGMIHLLINMCVDGKIMMEQ